MWSASKNAYFMVAWIWLEISIVFIAFYTENILPRDFALHTANITPSFFSEKFRKTTGKIASDQILLFCVFSPVPRTNLQIIQLIICLNRLKSFKIQLV